jgi:diaminohydroxyphosphoribosylaminopyrimidine deaminase/5-amino-6-(5-phosphoribosylamino)uracil reductase
VGIGTALADDPRLMPQPVTRRPFLRIVLDSRLRLPLDSQLVRSARRSPVWAVCGRPETSRRRALADRGVRVLPGPSRGGKVSLEWLLARLWQEGVTSLMVEGGSAVLGEFLAARLVDQVALFRAPIVLGGRDSLPAFGGPNPRRVSEALKLRPGNPVLPGLSLARGTQTGPGQVGPYEVWYPEGRPARLGEPPSQLTRATSRGE